MKHFNVIFPALLTLGLTTASYAQTADEIVNKHIEARGGKEKLLALKTTKMSGSMSVQGTDIQLTLTNLHDVGLRVDIEVAGTTNYQVANKKEGWVFMPVMGMAEPTKMDSAQLRSVMKQMDIQGTLLDYKTKGYTVTLEGSEDVGGQPAHKLKVVSADGRADYQYLDKKTFFLVKSAGKASVQGQEMDVESTYADYKKNADGYWFPHSITNLQGTMAFDKIETNVAVDEKLFSN